MVMFLKTSADGISVQLLSDTAASEERCPKIITIFLCIKLQLKIS